MIKKTIELDVKSNSKTADKDLKEIKKDIEAIGASAKKNLSGENVKALNRELEKTQKAAVSTKTRLRELEDEMADIGDVGSPQFQKLAAEAGALKDKMNNAKAAVNSMSADFPKLQLGTQAFQAIGGAAQGAMGAAALFGEENEQVQKSIQKLVAVQSVLNAVQTVANSLSDETALGLKLRTSLGKIKIANDLKAASATKGLTAVQKASTVATWLANGAMKALNFVMNMNPVMLIITGIVALVAAFKIFGKEAETVADSNARLNETLEKQDKIVDKLNKKRNKDQKQRMDRMKSDKATEREILAQTLADLKTEEEARKVQIDIELESIALLKRDKAQARKEENWELDKEIAEKIKARRDSYTELTSMAGDYQEDVYNITAAGNDKILAEDKAKQDKRVADYKEFLAKKKAAEDTQLAVLRELEQGRIDLLAEGFEKENEQIRNKYKIQREDLLANESLTASQKAELQLLHDVQEAEALKKVKETQLQAEIEAENTKQDALAEMLLQRGAEIPVEEMPEVIAEDIKGQAIFDIKEKWNQKAEKMRSITDSKIWKATEKGMNDSMTALTAIDDLNTMLTDAAVAKAGDNEAAAEKARKKGFERSKKLQLAMAVITGIQGVMAAFTAGSSMGPAGMVMGPLMAGLAAVGAAVNVSKIAKTKYEGGGASVSAATGSTAPPSVPSFNIAGNSTENQLATSLGSQEQQPIKAMVVSTEVTTAQSLDRNKVETASL